MSLWRGHTYESLARFIYGGDPILAPLLRNLNGPNANEYRRGKKPVKYPAPEYQVKRGDTLQTIGAYWVGGSMKSYIRGILPLNPEVKGGAPIRVGQWLVLPRVPAPQERARLVQIAMSNNGMKVAAAQDEPEEEEVAEKSDESAKPKVEKKKAAPLPPPVVIAAGGGDCEVSAFAPRSGQERLELVEWYLTRLENVKSRTRTDKMVDDLMASPPPGWRARYVAGQYYFKTERYPQARDLFKAALQDDAAPIQAGLMFLRASDLGRSPASGEEREALFKRFPALPAILEAGDGDSGGSD